jgi:hypothetical protein
MKKYRINIQFADPNAPDFDDNIMPVFDEAISNYNTKSLIAKNPKKITEKVVVDPRTLQLTLESNSELPFPSKALRLFSAYLVDPETKGALIKFIYGKQLFKMAAEEVIEDKTKQISVASQDLNVMRIKAVSLILTASEDTLRRVINLFEEV